MDISQVSKIDIINVEEINFNCEICGTNSFPKYEIKINEEENKYPICLLCHNQIAKQVSSAIKTRKRNY